MFPYQGQSGNQNVSNNTLLRNQGDQLHQNHIKSMFGYLDECQKSQELYAIITVLANEDKQFMADLETCEKLEGGLVEATDFWREVRDRCQKARKNGAIIQAEICRFKEHMARLNPNSIDRDMHKENQYRQLHERIRKTKLDIVAKLQKLRQMRLDKAKANSKSAKDSEHGRNQLSIGGGAQKIVLTELKDAIEVVDMELIKQREEIRLLIKQLYDEDV